MKNEFEHERNDKRKKNKECVLSVRVIKKVPLKISNKHVFCQYVITHLHFFIVRSHEIPKVKEFEMIERLNTFFCMETNNIQNKFFRQKIKQINPKTNKTNHHVVQTSVGAYISLYYHVRLREVTQVRFTSHLLSKT
jgi:hypothetical protein